MFNTYECKYFNVRGYVNKVSDLKLYKMKTTAPKVSKRGNVIL